MTNQADLARKLDALHVPGDPLIVTNVWDAITAKTVASAPGVRAIATASHAVSFAHGVADGEGLDIDTALTVARAVVNAVGATAGPPVTIDFERGYAVDAAGVETNVGRLIGTGAAGLNLEDSLGPKTMRPFEDSVVRVAAARAAGDAAGVPIVINARVDALARGGDWNDAVARANAYLGAGASVIFFLGLSTEELVKKAIDEVDGRISVISGPKSLPLATLARLGVSRVSFGPYTLGLTLSHLKDAAAHLTALGDYPKELGFEY